jgi:phosphatidylglycerophosphate synthase
MIASLPGLALLLYFLVALVIFAARGVRVDEEIANRPASPLLGRWLRHYIMWVLGPYERALVRLRLTPNLITLTSLAAAIGAAFALGGGHFALGGWLYLVTGMLDILDGRVARATHCVSRGGAYFDSVIDRYAELAVFCGLAYYYRFSSMALAIVMVAAVGSLMVSYARARGEGLGVDVRVGTMQRPERLFYLGVVIAHAPLLERLILGHPSTLHLPAVIALLLLGLSSNITAVRRIVHTLRILDGSSGEARRKLTPARRLLGLLRSASVS